MPPLATFPHTHQLSFHSVSPILHHQNLQMLEQGSHLWVMEATDSAVFVFQPVMIKQG